MADRYARLNHGYTGPHCGTLEIKPYACQQGTDDAQETASWSNLAVSLNALLLNPVLGTYSDSHGRRPVIMASVFALLLPSFALLAIMTMQTLHPIWYYLANSMIASFDLSSLVFAAFSDVIPESARAHSFGLYMSVFYGAFTLAPSLPLLLNHLQTVVASLCLAILACVLAVLYLPETLPDQVRETARLAQSRAAEEENSTSVLSYCFQMLRRPFRDISILAKDRALMLLAGGSFVSYMVFAADGTLVLYYIEEQLDFGDKDIASMFVVVGVAGLLLQGGAIQPLVHMLGEHGLLVAAFACGTFHNSLYGLAHSKATIYVALAFAQFTKLNAPVLSSLASKDASPQEQGRIQGALAAMNAIGQSVGPLTMEFVYNRTKDKPHLGPGFMFYYASMLYAVGAFLVALVPRISKDDAERVGPMAGLQEPLLLGEDEENQEGVPRDDEACCT